MMPAGLERILPTVVRPARYTGNEWNSIRKEPQGRLRVALAYPDVYEESVCDPLAQSVYHVLNREDDILCERVYTPWADMDVALKQSGIPLYALESQRPLLDFDVVLVMLPAELYYPTLLTLLDLATMPLRAAERRGQGYPFVMGIGPATANPEPMADFCDAFLIGDVDGQALRAAVAALRSTPAVLPIGLYIPHLYSIAYHADGGIASIAPARQVAAYRSAEAHLQVVRPIVPFVESRREQGIVELERPHPYPWLARERQERPVPEILAAVEAVLGSTGYTQVVLAGWHSHVDEIVSSLSARYGGTIVNITLDTVPGTPEAVDLADRLPHRTRGAITFDLPADRDMLLAAAHLSFRRGWHIVRLKVALGLPGETADDMQSLAALARQVRDIGRTEANGRAQVQVVALGFVPRAHGPWQRQALPGEEEWEQHLAILKQGLRGPGLRVSWQVQTRAVEAALARGDRRLSTVIENAWRAGMRRPQDSSDFAAWQSAFATAGLDVSAGLRARPEPEILPWSHLWIA